MSYINRRVADSNSAILPRIVADNTREALNGRTGSHGCDDLSVAEVRRYLPKRQASPYLRESITYSLDLHTEPHMWIPDSLVCMPYPGDCSSQRQLRYADFSEHRPRDRSEPEQNQGRAHGFVRPQPNDDRAGDDKVVIEQVRR
jgi:hypothetical protein